MRGRGGKKCLMWGGGDGEGVWGGGGVEESILGAAVIDSSPVLILVLARWQDQVIGVDVRAI